MLQEIHYKTDNDINNRRKFNNMVAHLKGKGAQLQRGN